MGEKSAGFNENLDSSKGIVGEGVRSRQDYCTFPIKRNSSKDSKSLSVTTMGIEEPVPEELPLNLPHNGARVLVNPRYKRRRMLAAVTLALVMVAAILIGVLVGRNHKKDAANSTNSNLEASAIGPETRAPSSNETDGNKTLYSDGENASEFRLYYESTVGPFDVKVPLYSPDNLSVYGSAQEAQEAFEVLAKFLININVQNNLQSGKNFASGSASPPEAQVPSFGDSSGGSAAGSAQNAAVMAPGNAGNVGDASSYQTNNQESGVDQADVAKSDGTYIYASYGDYLLVLLADKAEGTEEQLVLRLEMPKIDVQSNIFKQPIYYGDGVAMPAMKSGAGIDVGGNVSTSSSDTSGGISVNSSSATIPVLMSNDTTGSNPMPILPPVYWRPQPSIQSLLLSKNRLAIIVSGYNYRYLYSDAYPTCISDYLATQVRLYSTEDLETTGNLTLLGTQDFNGYFNQAYMVDDIAHIVTMSYVNAYNFLVGPISYWNAPFIGLTNDQYVASVKNASSQLIANFTQCLVEGLSATTGTFPIVSHLSLLSNATSNVRGLESVLFGDGYASSFIQITSFNMSEALTMPQNTSKDDLKLQVSVTIQFLPTSWGQVYSTPEMLVVAGQGSNWDPNTGSSTDTTYLFGFSLGGVVTMPVASGSVPGYILNEYSIDFVDGYFRVATTVRRWWPFVWISRPFAVDAVAETSTGATTTSTSSLTPAVKDTAMKFSSMPDGLPFYGFNVSTECPSVNVDCMYGQLEQICLKIKKAGCKEMFYPSDLCQNQFFDCLDNYQNSICPKPSDPCVSIDSWQACLALESRGCKNVALPESCPYGSASCTNALANNYSIPPVFNNWTICPNVDGECVTEASRLACLELEQQGCQQITFGDSCPYQLECAESSTVNYIFVLTASTKNSSELEVVGNVTMGKANEGRSFSKCQK